MKFSHEEKDKAEEYFNDVPWWLAEESSEEKGMAGGVWGLESKADIIPALLFASIPVIICGLLAHLFFGTGVGVAVVIVLSLIIVLWPLYKYKKSHKYEVEKEYVFVHNYRNPYPDRAEYVTTMKTIRLINTTVLVKKYAPLKLDNHVHSFYRLAEVGEER